ncbi:MAG TPA: sigma-70 family RNA polymerase sigma factor [Planctomycetota bacterium]|nr:sigma-70 family RNA polymerase sigma factor [Planctomycetota bacterium]
MAEPAEREVHTLVDQVTSGDPDALHTLLERYLPDLDRYVRRHTGEFVAHKESRSDLVQSVCREVLEALDRDRFEWRGEGPFREWLYRTALHKIQMKGRYFRAQRRNGGRERAPDDDGDDPALQVSRTPSMSASDREDRERFLHALQQLPAPQRQIVEWAHLEGVSHREIAARLGVSEANSRVMLSRALARLASIASERI